MPRANPAVINFTGGEFSPRLDARIDTEKYHASARTIENFICLPHGGITKRWGTRFVWYQRSASPGTEDVFLWPFVITPQQAYMMEVGIGYIRFFTGGSAGGSVVTTNTRNIAAVSLGSTTTITTATTHGYSNNDRVILTGLGGTEELNDLQYRIVNVTSTTFDLANVDSTGYTAWTGDGQSKKIVEVATPYTADELSTLFFAQSADVLFISHRNHPIKTLTRTGTNAFTLADLDILRGPWRTLNVDETKKIEASAKSGNVTLTATGGNVWTVDNVGSLWKLYSPSRTNGEVEFGTDEEPKAGGYWSYNGNVYEITAVAGPNNSAKYTPPTHKTGTVRLYENGETTDYVDAKFVHQGFGIARITGFTSATSVSATIYSGYGYEELPLQLVTGSARFVEGTKFWQEGAWSARRGYPSAIAIFEQRLMAAGGASQPDTIWGSVSGTFSDFEEGAEDDSALNYTIGSRNIEDIRWMIGGKVLMIGTSSGEYVMAATNASEPLSPDNIAIKRESSFGSSPATPVAIGNAVLYMERYGNASNPGRRLREMAYNFQINSWVSSDLTVWAEHITDPGVTQLAYQANPYPIVWGCKTDGRLCALTYERDQQVTAWHRHYLGGFSNGQKTEPALVTSIATMPGADGDELWMIVRRRINGGAARYIEKMTYFSDTATKGSGFFVDSAVRYSGDATTTVSGLKHLEGETVKVLADGNVQPDQVVTNGAITIPVAATRVNIGFGYTATLETLNLEAGAEMGSAQGKPGRIAAATLRLHRSLGGKVGVSASGGMEELEYRQINNSMDTAPNLYTGDIRVPMNGGWGRQRRGDERTIRVEHDQPLPFSVLGVFPEMTTSG